MLQENDFLNTDKEAIKLNKNKFIKDYQEDFLMSDKDFKRYIVLCHNKRLKRGLNIPKVDLCSDYKTREEFKTAEKEFLKICVDAHGP